MEELKKTVAENTADIAEIKHNIETIKNNHLHHIEKDMQLQSYEIARLVKIYEKMDMRLWAILILLVSSVVIGMITNGL
jgi:flagellar motility protein MotE (MotC chaperone)